MKILDIINPTYSFWNSLGGSGGTALPDNDKKVKVKGVDVWKKSPPFRKKNNKRANEGWTGPGPGEQGASVHPIAQPNTVIDYTRAREEMKGKNTKAEAKTSKKKRESFKRYLEKRSKDEFTGN